MLTQEMLRANTALTGLTDDQIKAITQMSQNDENSVIGARIGALHGQYDTDILQISGIAKNEGEKSYDYMKRVMTKFKEDAASTKSLTDEITQLKVDKADLEKKLANGTGDATLKQKLTDTENRLTQLQAQYTADKTKYADEKKAYELKIKDIYVNNAFDNAISGFTFKDGIDDSVKQVLLADAKRQVLAKGTPDFVDINGVKTLVFRDSTGAILNNPATNLAPYTASELLQSVDSLHAILGTSKTGSGTEKNLPPVTVPILGTAKTQVEADDAIAKHLMEKGLTRYSKEFAAEATKLRAELQVDKLPLR